MKKEEITNLLEPCLVDSYLDGCETITFITHQGSSVIVCGDKESEIYLLDEGMQINQPNATSLIDYSQIAMITVR